MMFGSVYNLTSEEEIDELEILVKYLSRQNIVESDDEFFDRVVSYYDWLKLKNDYKFDNYRLRIAIESVVGAKFSNVAFSDFYIDERWEFRNKVINSLSSAPGSILLNFRLYLYMIILLSTVGFGFVISSGYTAHLSMPLAAALLLIQSIVYILIDCRRKLFFFQKIVSIETKKSIPFFVALLVIFGLAGLII